MEEGQNDKPVHNDNLVNSIPVLLGLIPTFTGQAESVSVEEFLESVDEVGRLDQWGDPQKIFVVKAKCSGEAKDFFRGLLQQHRDLNFTRLRGALIERFSWSDPLSVRRDKFSSCRQAPGETVKQFTSRLELLAHQSLGIHDPNVEALRAFREERLLTQFMSGLLPKLKRLVMSHDPRSYSAAKAKAILEEGNEAAMASCARSVTFVDVERRDDTASELDELRYSVKEAALRSEQAIQALTAQMDRLETRLSHMGNNNHHHRQFGNGSRSSMGRDRAFSPSPQRYNSTGFSRSTVTCFRCRQIGHYANECRERSISRVGHRDSSRSRDRSRGGMQNGRRATTSRSSAHYQNRSQERYQVPHRGRNPRRGNVHSSTTSTTTGVSTLN